MHKHVTQPDDPRRIIIIDDNPEIFKDFKAILTSKPDRSELDVLESELFGHRQSESFWNEPRFHLDYAPQGRQGAEKIKAALERQQPYLLAFIDMRMPPGWDGLKTIEEIWKIDTEIQIVLCTAYSDYSWEEINQQLGVTQNLLILKKPFDTSEVAQLATTLSQKWILARKAQLKQDELEDLVSQRTEALRDNHQKLKQEMAERHALEEQLVRSQKMEAIGTLAAGVAHDLNNILSGILSYPDLLLMKMPEDDPMFRPLSIIRKSGLKAAAIVQDMLTLARRNVAVKEPIDVGGTVRGILDSPECQSLLEYHPQVRIIPRIASGLAAVLGSAVHLEKMTMNLVSNAAEAMDGAGDIHIDLSETQLEEPLQGTQTVKPGRYIKLSVRDQGAGIHPDDLNHIFEPFFTKKKMGRSGTGLGMTVVWDTVKHHDGHIDVSSQLGKGTQMSIYLPVTDERVNEPTQSLTQEDLNGDGESILVVDDVEDQRIIAAAIFNTLGYRVETVASGEAALDHLETQPADLLLLDMLMEPGMDGLDTYKHALAKYPGQKAVIASGYTKNSRVRSALKLGAIFINKPYRMEEIARAAKKALEKS